MTVASPASRCGTRAARLRYVAACSAACHSFVMRPQRKTTTKTRRTLVQVHPVDCRKSIDAHGVSLNLVRAQAVSALPVAPGFELRAVALELIQRYAKAARLRDALDGDVDDRTARRHGR